jgi:NADPH-dependent curcumin reductase CurA
LRRVPVSGLIAQYNGVGKDDGTDRLPATMREILSKSLTVRGFINNEFAAEHYPGFLKCSDQHEVSPPVMYDVPK